MKIADSPLNGLFFLSVRGGWLLKAAVLAVCLIALCGCSKQGDVEPAPRDMDWKRKSKDIVLNVHAVPSMNLFQNKAHTLALCVYQLSDDTAFLELASTKNGVNKLVECGRFDDSVVHSEMVIFAPDTSRKLTMDRYEGTKHLAIAAGYYESSPNQSARSVAIPVSEVSDGWRMFVPGAGKKAPGKLALDILLGKNGMQIAPAGEKAR